MIQSRINDPDVQGTYYFKRGKKWYMWDSHLLKERELRATKIKVGEGVPMLYEAVDGGGGMRIIFTAEKNEKVYRSLVLGERMIKEGKLLPSQEIQGDDVVPGEEEVVTVWITKSLEEEHIAESNTLEQAMQLLKVDIRDWNIVRDETTGIVFDGDNVPVAKIEEKTYKTDRKKTGIIAGEKPVLTENTKVEVYSKNGQYLYHTVVWWVRGNMPGEEIQYLESKKLYYVVIGDKEKKHSCQECSMKDTCRIQNGCLWGSPNGSSGVKTEEKTIGVVEEVKPVAVEKPVMLKLQDGMEVQLRGDGKLWYKGKAYGSEVWIPIKEKELQRKLTGVEEWMEIKTVLEKLPDGEWQLPKRVMERWVSKMIEMFTGESFVMYGRKKNREEVTEENPEWLAVVVKQEVSAASVDVDDFSKGIELLVSRGYVRVGTIHTHPGNGKPGCSATDKNEMWNGFGGIHFISSRSGDITTYYSVGDKVWDISGEEGWDYRKLWTTDEERTTLASEIVGSMVGEEGEIGEEVRKYVTEKTYKSNIIVYGGKQTNKEEENWPAYWSYSEKRWMIWDSKLLRSREATPSEIKKSNPDWDKGGMGTKTDGVKKSGIKKDVVEAAVLSTDSILEVIEKIEGWKWNPAGYSDIKRLQKETKCLQGTFSRYQKEISRLQDKWMKDMGEFALGSKAIEIIVYNVGMIEEALHGVSSIETNK